MLKKQARLGTYFSIKIPLAGEKGISWRESGEEAMNKGEQPDLSWAGQGRLGGLVQDPGLLSCPFLGHLELPGIPGLLELTLEHSKCQVPAQLILGDTLFLLTLSPRCH